MIERLLERAPLTSPEVEGVVAGLLDPGVPDAHKAGVLVALRARGDAPDELRMLADEMLARAVPVELGEVLDTAGTGGDGSGSLNFSTAAALVAAACGVPVAKHGNRAVSSQCGSADVLEALGIPLATDPATARDQLARHGFTFLLAPAFHPSTRALGPARRALGVRTTFNLLGPLTNPARPAFQLIGAATPAAAERLAGAARGHTWVVHGAPGWDEATPVGPFRVWSGGEVRQLDPLDLGIPRCSPDALSGGAPVVNAERLRAVFDGERGPARDTTVLNAALALSLARGAALPEAVAAASRALDDGRTRRLVAALSAP
ncbi:MAG: anthranilate phosphoribosyltransferase [Myxococcota bacterium]